MAPFFHAVITAMILCVAKVVTMTYSVNPATIRTMVAAIPTTVTVGAVLIPKLTANRDGTFPRTETFWAEMKSKKVKSTFLLPFDG